MLARTVCADVLVDACHDMATQSDGCLGRGLPRCPDPPAHCGLHPELQAGYFQYSEEDFPATSFFWLQDEGWLQKAASACQAPLPTCCPSMPGALSQGNLDSNQQRLLTPSYFSWPFQKGSPECTLEQEPDPGALKIPWDFPKELACAQKEEGALRRWLAYDSFSTCQQQR